MTEVSRPLQSPAVTPAVASALDTLVRMVERAGEFRASILLLSDDRRHLLDAAGPSLPAEYRSAIHGLEIGPDAGSCGTAAWLNDLVVVGDIARDPRWDRYRHLALPHGLAACWSQPIRGRDGAVLGTFAMYYAEPREPSTPELEAIATAAARAGVIIENARAGTGRAGLVEELA